MKKIEEHVISNSLCKAIILTTVWMYLPIPTTVRADTPYTDIEVEETAGYSRTDWPIQVGIPVYGDSALDALWLARVGHENSLAPVRFQIIDTISPAEHINTDRFSDVRLVELVFLIDLEAGETIVFRLFHGAGATGGRPAAAPGPSLRIDKGEHIARTVDTGSVRFGFHELSGQLLDYTMGTSDRRVHFTRPNRESSSPIHHNPDVWSPPGAWRHASQWDITRPGWAPEYQEVSGPLVWQTVRRGGLPNAKGIEKYIEASVSYAVFAGSPFLLASSSIEFKADLIIKAVRNNELVFSRGMHTHGMYIGHDGETHTLRIFNPEDLEEDFRHVTQNLLPPDLPFIGMYHEIRGDGIGIVSLDRHVYNHTGPVTAGGGGAHYYFYDGLKYSANFVYFCRAEVLNNKRRFLPTVIPSGSFFTERSAILVCPVENGENGASLNSFKYWTKRLRSPLRVRVKEIHRGK